MNKQSSVELKTKIKNIEPRALGPHALKAALDSPQGGAAEGQVMKAVISAVQRLALHRLQRQRDMALGRQQLIERLRKEALAKTGRGDSQGCDGVWIDLGKA
jgi:hypothetical protein